MSAVVSLRGEEIWTKGEPKEEVVTMLEQALELAKRGEIHGAHIVLVHDDGVARKGSVGRCNYATIGCTSVLLKSLIEDGLVEEY